jgi:hypothetical protein
MLPTSADEAVAEALAALERYGLLLFSDPALPSLVGIIVGEPLRASWWGHPRGGVIYHAMNLLDEDPSILSIKLIAGKVTYVHRRLWPAVVTLGSAREAWQLDGLSDGAVWLLDHVSEEGEVQTDLVVPPPGVKMRKRVADAARELERRLLVHASEVHTPSGAHAKVLETWSAWAEAAGVTTPGVTPEGNYELQGAGLTTPGVTPDAKSELEAAAARLAEAAPNGRVALPWRRSR